jgi:small nuclear ribonucleoprotein (snRNP)-like protein
MQAYDQHLNMVLGDVEETVTTVEMDEETDEEIIKVRHRFLSLALLLPMRGWDTSFVVLGV